WRQLATLQRKRFQSIAVAAVVDELSRRPSVVGWPAPDSGLILLRDTGLQRQNLNSLGIVACWARVSAEVLAVEEEDVAVLAARNDDLGHACVIERLIGQHEHPTRAEVDILR